MSEAVKLAIAAKLSAYEKGVIADRLNNDLAALQGSAELIARYCDDRELTRLRAEAIMKISKRWAADVKELFGLHDGAILKAKDANPQEKV